MEDLFNSTQEAASLRRRRESVATDVSCDAEAVARAQDMTSRFNFTTDGIVTMRQRDIRHALTTALVFLRTASRGSWWLLQVSRRVRSATVKIQCAFREHLRIRNSSFDNVLEKWSKMDEAERRDLRQQIAETRASRRRGSTTDRLTERSATTQERMAAIIECFRARHLRWVQEQRAVGVACRRKSSAPAPTSRPGTRSRGGHRASQLRVEDKQGRSGSVKERQPRRSRISRDRRTKFRVHELIDYPLLLRPTTSTVEECRAALRRVRARRHAGTLSALLHGPEARRSSPPPAPAPQTWSLRFCEWVPPSTTAAASVLVKKLAKIRSNTPPAADRAPPTPPVAPTPARAESPSESTQPTSGRQRTSHAPSPRTATPPAPLPPPPEPTLPTVAPAPVQLADAAAPSPTGKGSQKQRGGVRLPPLQAYPAQRQYAGRSCHRQPGWVLRSLPQGAPPKADWHRRPVSPRAADGGRAAVDPMAPCKVTVALRALARIGEAKDRDQDQRSWESAVRVKGAHARPDDWARNNAPPHRWPARRRSGCHASLARRPRRRREGLASGSLRKKNRLRAVAASDAPPQFVPTPKG
eukprot:TRINITY_DN30393_c0_g1_i1.p1 TRINITY_DN30393_c0_g1~~TRINITY_DN30393_c0_g1_i1.p1  ORF type:complete len:584 (+),score=98.10 TRINITY_DN30393_c0_g1_i1:67-1818(+)